MVILQQHSQTGDYLKHNRTTTQCGAGRVDPLADLKARPQWVAWRLGEPRSDGKRAKVPINPHTRRWAEPNDPSTWGSYQQALACEQEHGYKGRGFVFTKDDPYYGGDLDDCRDPKTGVIHPAALALAARIGTYWEISPSGTGIKMIGIGEKPGPRCKTDKTPWGGQIEIYDKKRFFTITGNTAGERGLPVRDTQAALDSVYREFFPEPEKPVQPPVRTGANLTRTLTEAELLEKARNGEHGPKFIALYDHGDISWSGNDASRADYHLCSQLAYWLGGDPARMEALFSQSALGQRDKWINRPDYRKTTIDRAIANTSRRYDPEKYSPSKGSTNTRDKLEEIHHYAVRGYGWEETTGNSSSGASDRDAFKAMLRAAWKANSLEIDMGGRELMVAAGFGKKATATKALTRLIDTHGCLVKIKDGSPGMAARYRIKDLTPSKRDHALIREKPHPCGYKECGPFLSKSVQIRNTSPISYKEFNKNGRRIPQGGKAPVSSVGKVAGRVLDLIHYYSRSTGKPVPVSLLEEKTDIRRDNLKSRPIRKLIEARLILEVEGGYTTPDNVEECLEWELKESGCNAKRRMQKERNAKDQEISFIHRMRKVGAEYDRIAAETGRSVAEIMEILKIPDIAPSYEELDRQKKSRQIRNADGYIGDLQKADRFGYFPNPESRESRLSSTAEVSKAKPPHEEPRESTPSAVAKVPKGNVHPPQPPPDPVADAHKTVADAHKTVADAHDGNCLCEDCTDAVELMNHYVSVVA
jgi:primase-polymerase (primpol)-like protein